MEEYIKTLTARLPELSWQLSLLGHAALNASKFPRGLFKKSLEMTPKSCMDEIVDDLKLLAKHKTDRSTHYLAMRVSQKINVLVRLCQINKAHQSLPSTRPLTVQKISTRQQWLMNLAQEIQTLRLQEEAVSNSLEECKKVNHATMILNIQAELGEIKRRLTLAEETLSHATNGGLTQ